MWWRGELLKQKQMSEQRLDGHEWSPSCPDDCLKIYLAIIIPSHHQHENTLNLRQTQNIFLLFDLRTSAPPHRRREDGQGSHATSTKWSPTFLPNFFCPLTFEGPAVRSPLFTKTNPTKSKYIISKSKETSQQYPHASLCQIRASDKQIQENQWGKPWYFVLQSVSCI